MNYIYNGSGSSEHCVNALERGLKELCGVEPGSIVKCDFSSPLPNAERILIPGGNALEMSWGHFTHQVAQKVQRCVYDEVKCLFSCAGSYVMAGNVLMRDSLDTFNFTELDASVGAICPAYPKANREARTVTVKFEGKTFPVFWNMGPSFCSMTNKVIAYYDDFNGSGSAACIKVWNAVHSGVHPEVSRLEEDATKPLQDALLKQMLGAS